MASSPDAGSLIGSVPFFSSLNARDKKKLLAQGKEMDYKAGNTIVAEAADVVAAADRAKIFLLGVREEAAE